MCTKSVYVVQVRQVCCIVVVNRATTAFLPISVLKTGNTFLLPTSNCKRETHIDGKKMINKENPFGTTILLMAGRFCNKHCRYIYTASITITSKRS